jgi:hypothetical protein
LLPPPSRRRRLSSITHSFPWLSSPRGYVAYVFLPRSPLSPLRVLARLACLIHAANVHSEPGSNPFGICLQLPQTKAQGKIVNGFACWRTLDLPSTTSPATVTLASNPHRPRRRVTELTHVQQPHQYGKADSQNHPTRLSKSKIVCRLLKWRGSYVSALIDDVNSHTTHFVLPVARLKLTSEWIKRALRRNERTCCNHIRSASSDGASALNAMTRLSLTAISPVESELVGRHSLVRRPSHRGDDFPRGLRLTQHDWE